MEWGPEERVHQFRLMPSAPQNQSTVLQCIPVGNAPFTQRKETAVSVSNRKGHSSTNGVWLWHRRLAGHCSDVKPPYSQHWRQTLLQIHQAATVPRKPLCSHPLKSSAAELREQRQHSHVHHLCSRGSCPYSEDIRHLRWQSGARSMGARIRHIFLDYWDVLGRIQERQLLPQIASQEK